MKPGPLHAWTVTLTEVFIPVLLVLGFLTPLDYGGVCALMLVACVTNHRQNGFFLSSAKEGYEYVASIAVLSITLGTLGPGKWSLDHAFDFSFPFDPGEGAHRHRGRRHRRRRAVPRSRSGGHRRRTSSAA